MLHTAPVQDVTRPSCERFAPCEELLRLLPADVWAHVYDIRAATVIQACVRGCRVRKGPLRDVPRLLPLGSHLVPAHPCMLVRQCLLHNMPVHDANGALES